MAENSGLYAIIRDRGRQLRVQEGEVVDIDLMEVEPGQTIEFSEVLAVGGLGEPKIGNPTVPEAKVLAEVKGMAKGKKVEILWWRRRKASRKHRGHRQRYTRVLITKILTGEENSYGT